MIISLLSLILPQTASVLRAYARPFVKRIAKSGLTLAFLGQLIPAGTIPILTPPMPGVETLVAQSSIVNPVMKPIKKRALLAVLTAYSSTPDQTDDTPFITASGYHVTDGVVAANFLPFNTRIQIPKLFGDKIFVVKDRMHHRFSDRVDIWFPDRASAKNFGLRRAEIVVL
ncbi:MAG: 3D domain-containing protein [Candidatus Harrisonbacteria bacterium]|nr:3D domain-containing protein [Candidatus Harrisonbacteria bacterium]MBI2405973.1 3D domain-containing protein [Candidatus Harrisonbacteria bacterium]MBI2603958.1 3D domain-containing protein [Candidatus Harrisonbacteria bacterium]